MTIVVALLMLASIVLFFIVGISMIVGIGGYYVLNLYLSKKKSKVISVLSGILVFISLIFLFWVKIGAYIICLVIGG